jgi:hypothetical protein
VKWTHSVESHMASWQPHRHSLSHRQNLLHSPMRFSTD